MISEVVNSIIDAEAQAEGIVSEANAKSAALISEAEERAAAVLKDAERSAREHFDSKMGEYEATAKERYAEMTAAGDSAAKSLSHADTEELAKEIVRCVLSGNC